MTAFGAFRTSNEKISNRAIITTLVCAATVMLVAIPFAQAGVLSTSVAAGISVLLISPVALVGFFSALPCQEPDER